MRQECVRVNNLSKQFVIFKKKKTTLRALRSLMRLEQFKQRVWILRNISFEISKGDKVAIIGKNGSGKTTLLRILVGIYDKTSGEFEISGDAGALFRFWVGLNIDLPVIDNIYLFGAIHGMDRKFLRDNAHKILELAELEHLRFSPLKDLSIGQRQRLALSIFFHVNSELMIFDESLAFVDQSFAHRCEEYFRDLYHSEKTAIITSHDLNFLRKYCTRAIWLDEGRIRMDGEADKVISEYALHKNQN